MLQHNWETFFTAIFAAFIWMAIVAALYYLKDFISYLKDRYFR